MPWKESDGKATPLARRTHRSVFRVMALVGTLSGLAACERPVKPEVDATQAREAVQTRASATAAGDAQGFFGECTTGKGTKKGPNPLDSCGLVWTLRRADFQREAG